MLFFFHFPHPKTFSSFLIEGCVLEFKKNISPKIFLINDFWNACRCAKVHRTLFKTRNYVNSVKNPTRCCHNSFFHNFHWWCKMCSVPSAGPNMLNNSIIIPSNGMTHILTLTSDYQIQFSFFPAHTWTGFEWKHETDNRDESPLKKSSFCALTDGWAIQRLHLTM